MNTMNTMTTVLNDVVLCCCSWATLGIMMFALFGSGVAEITSAGVDMWSMHGFEGEAIRVLVIDPTNSSVLYVGTKDGLSITTNGGQSWRAINAGLRGRLINALVIDPTAPAMLHVVVGEGSHSVLYKSTDRGENWATLKTFDQFVDVNTLVINPVHPSTLYAASGRGLMYKSTDRGESWQKLADIEHGLHVLVIDPKNSSTLYVGTRNNDVMKSTDGGKRWRSLAVLLESPFDVTAFAIDATNPAILYAGTYSGVYKSTNRGEPRESWKEINTGVTLGAYSSSVGALAIDPTNPSTLYMSMRGGVYKSTTGGENWRDITTGLAAVDWINPLVIDPTNPSTLYAGTPRGIWVMEQTITAPSTPAPAVTPR